MIHILKNTITFFIRNRFFYAIIVLGLVLILSGQVLSGLSVEDGSKIIIDFSLSGIEFVMLIFVIFFGSIMIIKEKQDKTLFFILSKGRSLAEFIIGKFLGFISTLAFMAVGLSVFFIFILVVNDISFSFINLMPILEMFFKLFLLSGFVFLFSILVGHFTNIVISFILYFVCHSLDFLYYQVNIYSKDSGLVSKLSVNLMYYLLPHFKQTFEVRDLKRFTTIPFFLEIVGYIVYTVFLILLLRVIMSRQDLAEE